MFFFFLFFFVFLLSWVVILLGAGTIGLLLAATVALWAHYGTAIFFETIRAGLAACFG